MATKRTPNNLNQSRQLNRDDRSGELWSTRGIDLSTSPSKILKANSIEIIADDGTLDSSSVTALRMYEGKMYALTANALLSSTTPYNHFTEESNIGGIDLVVFKDLLIIVTENLVSGVGNLYSWDGTTLDTDWWTDISGAALDQKFAHNIMVARTQGKDTLSVTNGSELKYYNAEAGHTAISWDSELIGICQTDGLNAGWVGTYNQSNARAEVIRWQIGNDEYTQSYPIEGAAVLAMATKLNTPYIIDEKLRIQKFVQAGFRTIAQLSLLKDFEISDGVETSLIQRNDLARPVHPKGMWFDGDKLMVVVNTDSVSANSSNINERCPAGLYEVDVLTGSVNHKGDYAGEAVIRTSSPLLVLNDTDGRYYFAGRKSDGDRALYRQTPNTSDGFANFVLTEFHSESSRDTFSSIYMASLQSDDMEIVIKKRNKALPSVFTSVTWLDEKSFTTTDDLSLVKDGYEVEFMSGQATGQCVHIKKISKSANTYTVILEDSVGVKGKVSNAYIGNWERKSLKSNKESIQQFVLDTIATKNQVKVYLKGTSIEIDRLIEVSHNKEELK